MWEEDYPPPGFRTIIEGQYFGLLATLGLFMSWVFGGNSIVVDCVVAVSIIIGPCLYFNYRMQGFGVSEHPIRDLSVGLLPIIVTWIIFAISLLHPVIAQVVIQSVGYFELREAAAHVPTSVMGTRGWLTIAVTTTLYLSGLLMLYLVDSQYFIRRLMNLMCLNAAVLAFFGFVQELLDFSRIFGLFKAADRDFFATFAHGEHWASFALLWLVIYIGMIQRLIGADGWSRYLAKGGIWLSLGAVILASSVVYAGTAIHVCLLCLTLAAMLLRWAYEHLQHKARGAIRWVGISSFGLLSAGIATYGLWFFYNAVSKALVAGAAEPMGIPLDRQLSLWRQAWELFLERPWFGWGASSYGPVTAFYPRVEFADYYFTSPHSSLLLFLFEHGIVGALLWLAVPCFILVRFLLLKGRRITSYIMLGACLAGAVLGVTTFAFQNAAFVFSYWLILFGALQWSVIDNRPKGATMVKPDIVFTNEELQLLTQFKENRKTQPHSRTRHRGSTDH